MTQDKKYTKIFGENVLILDADTGVLDSSTVNRFFAIALEGGYVVGFVYPKTLPEVVAYNKQYATAEEWDKLGEMVNMSAVVVEQLDKAEGALWDAHEAILTDLGYRRA